ncbi:sideroflexin-4 isoform X1 [Dermochelys coriacea]|uniref:sideroflexin-4 isoform X1 n=1 Tax=Dermochelys coriacea TaxID=27794 RepID=UPI0018E705A6|nr:sideroflexin-4 isoform X1 [Dermochelys coriacea]
MDVNLQFWSTEGKSFFQRFLHWADILDPTILLKSNEEIEKSRLLLQTGAQTLQEPLRDKKVKQAWKLSLSSVHPGTGEIIPLVFRPPAFLPLVSPLVFASLLPHRGAKQAFIWQFLFHAYAAGFTIANGNATAKTEEMALPQKLPQKQLLLSTGAVSYAACMGAFPHFLMTQNRLNSPSIQMFFRKILPIPLLACLSAFNVMIVRETEYENGIEVMDKNGKVVGVSQKAGLKAVQETALSRAAFFGTAVIIPESLLYFLQRTNFLLRNPHALTPLRLLMTVSALGALLPVSFSVFPQLGEIKRDDLEKEILTSTEETVLFYNRGV